MSGLAYFLWWCHTPKLQSSCFSVLGHFRFCAWRRLWIKFELIKKVFASVVPVKSATKPAIFCESLDIRTQAQWLGIPGTYFWGPSVSYTCSPLFPSTCKYEVINQIFIIVELHVHLHMLILLFINPWIRAHSETNHLADFINKINIL